MGTGINLHAENGIPGNLVNGQGPGSYSFGYDFEQFQGAGGSGIILPPLPYGGAPGIFELKDPDDNIRGVVS